MLHVVAAREPVSQREVSDALLLDPSDVVTLVDILERAGLVERKRDPADRRRYALEVTTAGQLAVVRLREINHEANQELLAPLDADERAQLAALLARVVSHHTGHTTDPAGDPPGDAADPAAADPAAADPAAADPAADRPARPAVERSVETATAEEGAAEMRPVLPGHPEKAPVAFDPNAAAEGARGLARQPTRP